MYNLHHIIAGRHPGGDVDHRVEWVLLGRRDLRGDSGDHRKKRKCDPTPRPGRVQYREERKQIHPQNGEERLDQVRLSKNVSGDRSGVYYLYKKNALPDL